MAEGPSRELAAPAQPGFVVAYDAANDTQSIREEIAQGETVQDWSRMVTTQSFRLPGQVTPAQFVEFSMAPLPQSCPGAQISKIATAKRDGLDGATVNVDCPLLPETGKPESFYLLAVRDGDFILVKQAAFRSKRTPELVGWAEAVLDSTHIAPAK
ncbi:MAG: hypothetical protein IE933_09640 [Sphingomonadales bacterium]|nr:hypothetical protein [Sphingomonadales bacterium]MBD3774700.1 hypothetical protein [Paracoccaceae bacterium]